MVMKNPLRSGIVALIAVVFCTANSWAARSSGARLTIADNKVTIAGQPAASGTAITPGDTIVTGSRSRAELMLPDGTVVRIGQGSSFTYTGSKLVLNQGTALVHVTHKNTTVISGSRTYTGGPAVVSAEVSKKTDGLYILQGGGKVNGVTLIPGQTSVLDRGKDRTFTFDLQKMEASSALVTKFPQTPWIVQTETLGAVQHQLLTAKVTPAGKSRPQGGSQDNVSGSLASLVSTGAAGTSLASRTGSSNSPGGGALQLLGGPLSLGADKVAVIKSAAISSFTNGGTLQVSGVTSSASLTLSGVILTSASLRTGSVSGVTVNLNNANVIDQTQGSLTKAGGGVLVLNGGTQNYGASNGSAAGTATLNVSNFNLNTTISAGSLSAGTTTTSAVTNTTAGLTAGVGVLTINGANTYTGVTTVNAGTLTVNNGGVIPGNLILNSGNTLNLAAGASISKLATITYQQGASIVVGGAPLILPQQAGQNVTINGINYLSAQPGGAGTNVILQPVAH